MGSRLKPVKEPIQTHGSGWHASPKNQSKERKQPNFGNTINQLIFLLKWKKSNRPTNHVNQRK
ncbi:hypothetical protein [Allofranklinella schreckenbergeri]|uniref:hypothetical protein n=1 Tax=Allofranklinella schreckenbergeri TaxID=1076744 RepID=UPI001EED663B|nr:hypothetical protein [Allofranklinella schreckenbergeri]